MENILKFKLGLSLFSISILTLLPLLRTNFNAPVTIKRWGELTWDDFQGIVKPFTGYAAVISSRVYLEYDSLNATYKAYAGQNNMWSWTKESTTHSDYALNHEQYHFNITEVHARIMNEYIVANPARDEAHYRAQLAAIHTDLNWMQDQYDQETDHSLNQDKQRRWEYKVDSLLLNHSTDSGWVVDYYSGAKAYFPVEPAFLDAINENQMAYRIYSLTKYSMNLALSSFQFQSPDFNNMEDKAYEYFKNNSMDLKYFQLDTINFDFKFFGVSYDSVNNNIHNHLWVCQNKYLYQLIANYPFSSGDTLGYQEIANSFISSFKIINTDNYWIDKFENSTSLMAHEDLRSELKEGDPDYSHCVTYSSDDKPNGFYRGPIYRDDGGLLLAYDIIEHDDSLLFENILVINEDLYVYEPDSANHIYFVPGDKIPEEPYQLNFGYLLTRDSINKCCEFHYQSIH